MIRREILWAVVKSNELGNRRVVGLVIRSKVEAVSAIVRYE